MKNKFRIGDKIMIDIEEVFFTIVTKIVEGEVYFIDPKDGKEYHLLDGDPNLHLVERIPSEIEPLFETEPDRRIIIIDNEYSVTSDSFCWILTKKPPEVGKNPFTGEQGKESRGTNTYHNTLSQVFKKYLDNCLKRSSSIEEILERIDQAERKIDQLVGDRSNLNPKR